MDNITVEECTADRVPSKLRTLIDSFDIDATVSTEVMRNDLFVALLYVMMLECGFKQAEEIVHGLSAIKPAASTSLSQNWKTKHGMYVIKFTLWEVPDCPANLMVNPVGSTMLINLMLPDLDATTYSVCTPVYRYVVSPFALQIPLMFSDLPELSVKFKGSIAYPARSAILAKYGYANASLIGIPYDVQLNIFSMLKARDLCNLAQTCRHLRRAINNSVLWKKILHRDFPDVCVNNLDDCVGNYKTVFLKKQEDKKQPFWNNYGYNDFTNMEHSSWDIFIDWYHNDF